MVVLGGGSFGTAMASHVAGRKAEMEVIMLVRDPQICQSINEKHCNGWDLYGLHAYHLINFLAVFNLLPL